ncbi:MAG TPA: zf-HC2 domain-containing protein [Candidatus Eisenbacteria bacterium]
MTCAQARRLFGACWDDEITQAERESLEAHFASCAGCREEYDTYCRTLELVTTLPRIEPAPDLLERALARSRRMAPAPDRVGAAAFPWVPVTATAALMIVAFSIVSPWLAPRAPRVARDAGVSQGPVLQPELRPPSTVAARTTLPGARGASLAHPGLASDPMASVPDSLFDHSDDVEFILDPMTLHRGRPAAVRARSVQGQQATITF